MKNTKEFNAIVAGLKSMETAIRKTNRQLAKMCKDLGVKPTDLDVPEKAKQPKVIIPKYLMPNDMALLKRFNISGNEKHYLVYAPGERMDPKSWAVCKQALEGIGGKWNTPTQAFMFSNDPTEKIAQMTASGKRINEQKDKQAFYTPGEVAFQVVKLADVHGKRVLEPSAGRGALAVACRAAGAAQVQCCENDPEAVDFLIGKGFGVYVGDFLKYPTSMKFSRIVMNPPFAKGQMMAHIKHALDCLEVKGRLVAIIQGGKEQPKLDKALKDGKHTLDWSVNSLGKGAFQESGTSIETSILVIRKYS